MKAIFNRLEDIIVVSLLVAVTLLVFIEVILRFGFNTGIHWAQEATLLISAWLVLLGASWCVREQAHICVDALVTRLPVFWRKIMILVAVGLCLLYCGLFSYGSWVYLKKLYIIGIELDDIALPKWIAQSVLVIGFALLALRFIEFGVRVVRGEVEGFHRHNNALLDEAEIDNPIPSEQSQTVVQDVESARRV